VSRLGTCCSKVILQVGNQNRLPVLKYYLLTSSTFIFSNFLPAFYACSKFQIKEFTRVTCLPSAASFGWACSFACPTLFYSIISIVAFALLVCCFLCSQLFALPFTDGLQLVNHHFTLPIFLVEAQPHTREANAPLSHPGTPSISPSPLHHYL